MIRRHLVVSGRVQGVFFRASCADVAQDHGVSGWVSNEPDDTLHAAFEGEEDAVRAMVDWCHHGPSAAAVDGVDVTEQEPLGESGFEVR